MKITAVRARSLANPDQARPPYEAPGEPPLGGSGPFRMDVPPLPEPEALTVVEIETDEELTGYGTVGGFAVGAAEIVNRHYAPLLVGEDPSRIEAHWDRLHAASARSGVRGMAVMAVSGVDLALWDLLGKATGRPVCDLIGGRTKDRVPVYASVLSNTDGLDALGEQAAELVSSGFRAMKYFVSFGARHGPAGMQRELAAVQTIRAAVGPDAQLMVDAHFKWDLAYAQRMMDGLADLNVEWLENPLPPDDLPGYERLARMEAVPLAAGEFEQTRFPFVNLIDAGVFYLQPDINRVGGLTETLRICGLAASHHRPVCPHQGWLHSWHLIAAKTCCPIGEYFPKRDPLPGNALIWTVLEGEPEAESGSISVPERPGFGWTLNEAEVARRAVG